MRDDSLSAKVVRKGLGAPRRFPGYLDLARWFCAREVPIVMYHGVVERPLPVFHWCHLEVSEFERQIAFLSEKYRVLPLAEIVDRMAKFRPLPDRTAAITFDDGFRSVYRTALPILEKYDVPFTVFVVTGLIESRQPPWPDRLYNALVHTRVVEVESDGEVWNLSTSKERAAAYQSLGARLKPLPFEKKEERLIALSRALDSPPEVEPNSPLATLGWDEILVLSHNRLASVGSHTHTHQILSQCSEDRQREELGVSRDMLRDRLGDVHLFAYPNGSRADFNDATKRLLVELGYTCGVATIPGINRHCADRYELKRVNVGADTTLSHFQLRMLGW